MTVSALPFELQVRPVRRTDLGAFAAHIVRHLAESGRDGQAHFAPLSRVERDDVMRESERRWNTPLSHPGWGRVWVLASVDPAEPSPLYALRIVGHVELRGPSLHSALHRADLSMGIEQAYRGHGFGGQLARAAVSYAFAAPQLAWLDLRVFAVNARARQLYERLGFRAVGEQVDAFRMPDGDSISDVWMTLELARGARSP